MILPTDGWRNKGGTAGRSCNCGSWKQHWINFSSESWPLLCSVEGCVNKAVLGAHIYNTNSEVTGEYIAPTCDSCNKLTSIFSLKDGTTLVSANKQKTCAQ